MPVDKETLCVAGVEGKEIAEKISGTDNYTGIFYSYGYKTTTSTKRSYNYKESREPDSLTDPDNLSNGADTNISHLNIINNILGTTLTTSDDFKEYMQNEYNDFVNSIKINGGFYVGRYESSLSSSTKTVEGTTGNIQSKRDIMPTSSLNSGTYRWYGLYAKQREYAQTLTGTNVKSTMIYNSMYDAIMNWALYGDDRTDASKINEHSISHGPEYTGALEDDRINNIYDLGNNLYEWTAGANNTYYRIARGSRYSETDMLSCVGGWFAPRVYAQQMGSRMILYM